jgi:hypothetical protein
LWNYSGRCRARPSGAPRKISYIHTRRQTRIRHVPESDENENPNGESQELAKFVRSLLIRKRRGEIQDKIRKISEGLDKITPLPEKPGGSTAEAAS